LVLVLILSFARAGAHARLNALDNEQLSSGSALALDYHRVLFLAEYTEVPKSRPADGTSSLIALAKTRGKMPPFVAHLDGAEYVFLPEETQDFAHQVRRENDLESIACRVINAASSSHNYRRG